MHARLHGGFITDQDVHEISPWHEVKQEVQVVAVLEGGVLADAEGVGHVAGDDLYTGAGAIASTCKERGEEKPGGGSGDQGCPPCSM
jgi:hypothetical protein